MEGLFRILGFTLGFLKGVENSFFEAPGLGHAAYRSHETSKWSQMKALPN